MCLSERFREILAPHSKALRGTFPMLYIAVTKICDLCMKTQRIHCPSNPTHPLQSNVKGPVLGNSWTFPFLFPSFVPSNHTTIPLFCSYLKKIKSSTFGCYLSTSFKSFSLEFRGNSHFLGRQ